MRAKRLIQEFERHKLGPYIEVPCSILSPVIKALMADDRYEVFNPANEAIGMGMAAGSYLSSGRIPVLLIQNSGFYNTLNGLTSLNHTYKIPLLYLISWRGQPGTKDAPEHTMTGLKMRQMLRLFEVPYQILSEKGFKDQIGRITNKIKISRRPAALLLGRGLIEKEEKKIPEKTAGCEISRAGAVEGIIEALSNQAVYVTTNGYISREAMRVLSDMGLEKACPCFYMLGSMGHALPIGLSAGRFLKKGKKVVILDGDGGCLMHLGAMASVGKKGHRMDNIIHVVLDNRRYASTGGQPTVSSGIDFRKIAYGCGYKSVCIIKRLSSLRRIFKKLIRSQGPCFAHILIDDKGESPGPRVSGRYSCIEIKESFTNLLRPLTKG